MHPHMHTHKQLHACAHTHIYTYICPHKHVLTCAHAHTHMHICAYTWTCTHMHMHAHTCTRAHSHTHTHHIPAYTHKHVYTCTHLHMHTHEHIHTIPWDCELLRAEALLFIFVHQVLPLPRRLVTVCGTEPNQFQVGSPQGTAFPALHLARWAAERQPTEGCGGGSPGEGWEIMGIPNRFGDHDLQCRGHPSLSCPPSLSPDNSSVCY